MVKFLALAAVLAAAAACGAAEVPPQNTFTVPQSTFVPPQVRAGCQCPNGGPCVCLPGECNCDAARNCTNKARPTGVVADFETAVAVAAKYGCPIVAFVGREPKPVPGAVAYYQEPRSPVTRRVEVMTRAGGGWAYNSLTLDAPVSEIMVACNPGRRVVGHTQVCDESGCRQLPLFEPIAAAAFPVATSYAPYMPAGGG